MSSVNQSWVHDLTFQQQGVLMSSIRGPDGFPKYHPAKIFHRWLRRCIMVSAYDGGKVFEDPYQPGGGSFMGPCEGHGVKDIKDGLHLFIANIDELPHHYVMHFIHAAEIIGYKHPTDWIREFWQEAYLTFTTWMHVHPETMWEMDERLNDKDEEAHSMDADIKRAAYGT